MRFVRLEWCRWRIHGGTRRGCFVRRRKRELAKDYVESAIPYVNHDGIATGGTNLEQGFRVFPYHLEQGKGMVE